MVAQLEKTSQSEIIYPDSDGKPMYDPDINNLVGFLRRDDILEMIEDIDGWKSPRLGIRFQLSQPELNIYYPNGDRFSTYNEEKQKVLEKKERAEKEKERADKEKERADKLEAKLRELGVNLD